MIYAEGCTVGGVLRAKKKAFCAIKKWARSATASILFCQASTKRESHVQKHLASVNENGDPHSHAWHWINHITPIPFTKTKARHELPQSMLAKQDTQNQHPTCVPMGTASAPPPSPIPADESDPSAASTVSTPRPCPPRPLQLPPLPLRPVALPPRLASAARFVLPFPLPEGLRARISRRG